MGESNRVHDLQALVAEQFADGPAPADLARALYAAQPDLAPLYPIADEYSFYEILAQERQRKGWTLAEAEARMGLPSANHLSKIEPARHRDRKRPAYVRQCVHYKATDTLHAAFAGLGVCLVIMDQRLFTALRDVKPPAPVKLTSAQRRRAGVYDTQPDLFDWKPKVNKRKAVVKKARARPSKPKRVAA